MNVFDIPMLYNHNNAIRGIYYTTSKATINNVTIDMLYDIFKHELVESCPNNYINYWIEKQIKIIKDRISVNAIEAFDNGEHNNLRTYTNYLRHKSSNTFDSSKKVNEIEQIIISDSKFQNDYLLHLRGCNNMILYVIQKIINSIYENESKEHLMKIKYIARTKSTLIYDKYFEFLENALMLY